MGAGWIGSEVAASARQRGLDVTVVDPLAVPLERVLGAEVGAVFRDAHADHGVRMLMRTSVEAFEGEGAVERVRTAGGRRIECDFVVVGIGVQPPEPSWGNIIFENQTYFQAAPWLVFFPGVAILLLALAFNLVGDALRDVLDPTQRGRG